MNSFGFFSPSLATVEPSVENFSIPNQFLSAPKDIVGIQMTSDKACPEVDLLCKTREKKIKSKFLKCLKKEKIYKTKTIQYFTVFKIQFYNFCLVVALHYRKCMYKWHFGCIVINLELPFLQQYVATQLKWQVATRLYIN